MHGTLKWRKLSFLCESILENADLESLAEYFVSFDDLEEELIDKLVTGEHSYIVIRAALRRFVKLANTVNNVEHKMVKSCAKSLKSLTQVYKREENSIIRRLRNKYSSLLFRDLIATQSGIIWSESTNSYGNFDADIRLPSIPKACRKQFNSLIEEVISIPNIDDLGLCEKASPALGQMLVISKIQRDDVRLVLLEHLKPENSKLKEYLKSGPGGFLLEKILFAMNEAELKAFYDSWIRGRLEELFIHERGNFLLQRVLLLSSETLFENIIKQMTALGLLKQAWINNKGGVLARFSERAIELTEDKQTTVIESLKNAVCIQNPNFAHSLLIDNQVVSYQGGLICQAITQYNGRARKILLDDLLNLEESDLEFIFDSAPGSYLIEKMGSKIQEKKFIEILRKIPVYKFAFGRFGSRGIEGLWKNGSIKLKAALCELLKDVHKELGQSQFGRHVNAKLRVTDYVKSKERWEQNQKSNSAGNKRAITDSKQGYGKKLKTENATKNEQNTRKDKKKVNKKGKPIKKEEDIKQESLY